MAESRNFAKGAIRGLLKQPALRILDNSSWQERFPISDLAADKSGNRSNPIRTNPGILDSEEIYHVFSENFEGQNTETR
jgi:hypothetical protein